MYGCGLSRESAHAWLGLGYNRVYGQESEPAVGRLLVFSVDGQGAERKVNLVAEEEARGSVYVLNGFNGKLLAGINSKVCDVWCVPSYLRHTSIYRGNCEALKMRVGCERFELSVDAHMMNYSWTGT